MPAPGRHGGEGAPRTQGRQAPPPSLSLVWLGERGHCCSVVLRVNVTVTAGDVADADVMDGYHC